MNKCWLALVVILGGYWGVHAQGILEQNNEFRYHQIDRLLIQNPDAEMHPSLQYYDHLQLIQLAERALENPMTKEVDKRFARQILGENGRVTIITQSGSIPSRIYTDSSKLFYTLSKDEETVDAPSKKGLKRWFFTSPGYLWSKYDERYFLRFNPVIHFRAGSSSTKDGALFQNTRGLELSGGIGKRFFFFTNIIENQSRFAEYVDDYINPRIAIPGNGFYKRYQSQFFDLRDAYDYLNSTGYLAVKVSPEVGFTIGHGRHFIGNGIRSSLLSDFSNNYFYIQADWKFWKIHYRNIWSEVKPRSSRAGLSDEEVRRKYIATHHLSLKLRPNLHFGIFESVVFDRSDQFELGYLNPVILYRTVEQSLSSPDNVLLGLDLRWDLWKKVSLYGQINFDEFVFSELVVDRNGWWGNKYGWQLGAKYFDAFKIDHLDLQVEYNGARPYTYSHRDSSASYSHSNLPLAHPLGSNFKEWIIQAKYQIGQRWSFSYLMMNYQIGRDINDENYGSNILLPHDTRIADYGIDLLQGEIEKVRSHQFGLSFQLFPKCWIDLQARSRRYKQSKREESEMLYDIGLRWNIGQNRMLF